MSELITRRAVVLHGAAAVLLGAGAMIFGKPSSAAALAPSADAAEATDPATLRASGGPLGIEGVRSEYREAINQWPFPLPANYSMPAETRLSEERGVVTELERGSGVADAFFVWASLTAVAAATASKRGDGEAAQQHLTVLANAYNSQLARTVVDDPNRTYITEFIDPARTRNDFSPIVALYGLDRLDPEGVIATAARRAGD